MANPRDAVVAQIKNTKLGEIFETFNHRDVVLRQIQHMESLWYGSSCYLN